MAELKTKSKSLDAQSFESTVKLLGFIRNAWKTSHQIKFRKSIVDEYKVNRLKNLPGNWNVIEPKSNT